MNDKERIAELEARLAESQSATARLCGQASDAEARAEAALAIAKERWQFWEARAEERGGWLRKAEADAARLRDSLQRLADDWRQRRRDYIGPGTLQCADELEQALRHEQPAESNE